MWSYLPSKSCNKLFKCPTALSVAQDRMFVLLPWSYIEHCYLVGLAANEKEEEEEEENEEEKVKRQEKRIVEWRMRKSEVSDTCTSN